MIVAALAAIAFWLLALAGIAVDPYDVYPWGTRVTLRSNYQPDQPGYLTWMAARDPEADVVVVGSSTALLYTPYVLRRTFPNARKVWNVSYRAARPRDRDMVLKVLASHGRPKRVIVTLDYFYSGNPDLLAPNFPSFFYDGRAVDDLRVINGHLPRVLLSVWRTGEPFATGPGTEQAIEAKFAKQYRESKTPAVRMLWKGAVDRQKARIAEPGRTSCKALLPFDRQLLPALRALSAKGVRVDVLLPPYSPVMYYMFLDRADHLPIEDRGFLADQMLLRRCAVTETAGLRGVAVWAPDRDFALIGNLDNFRDPGHLAWGPLGQQTLRAIGDPRYQLTLDNVDDYVERMRALVVNFRLSGGSTKK